MRINNSLIKFNDFMRFLTPKQSILKQKSFLFKNITVKGKLGSDNITLDNHYTGDYEITDRIQFSLASLIAREIELSSELEQHRNNLLQNNEFTIFECFKAIDWHDSGFIDLMSLKMFFKQQGHYLTDEDLAIMISRIGKVQELVITYASFWDHFELKDKNIQQRPSSRSPILMRKFIPALNINDIYEHHTTRSQKEQHKFSFNDDLTDSKENAKTSFGQTYKYPNIYSLNTLLDEQGLPHRYTDHTPSKEKSLHHEALPGCFTDVFKFPDYERTENINIQNNLAYEASSK